MTPVNEELFAAFFPADKDWDLAKIRAGSYPAQLQFQLDKLLQPAFTGSLPCALPRIASGGQLLVYVLGAGRRELSELLRVLQAHLGSVNAILDPSVVISANDAPENVLLENFSCGFLRVSIPLEVNPDKQAVYEVFGRISAALERYSTRPSSVSIAQRPIGRILSDFFVAFNRNDGDAACQLLDELRDTKKLSARNMVSIELQTMAASSRWQQLLHHPKLQEILPGRVPRAITEILLKGVQKLYIPSDSPAEHEREQLAARLAELELLFVKAPSLDETSPVEAWKSWAIGAVALGNLRAFNLLPAEVVDQDWIAQLHQWSGVVTDKLPSIAPVETVTDLVPSLDAAVALLKESVDATESDGLAIYRRLEAFPEDILSQVCEHSGLARTWNGLVEDFSEQESVGSWSAWYQSLLNSPENALPLSSIHQIFTKWSSSDWDEDQVKGQLFDLLDSSDWEIARASVPYLRQWLVDHGIALSAELISQLLMMLAVDEVYSVQDLALIEDLIGDLVGGSHTEDQYRDAVTAAITCWGRVKSVNALAQGLGLMDVLLDSTCADSQSRLSYWNGLQEFCLSTWVRLPHDQQLVVRQFADELVGSSDQFAVLKVTDESEVPGQIDLSGKRLAIYTLTEGAGRRASQALGRLFPGLEIQLNHDKTATDLLKNMAKTADYFVFASRSAAHQAFYSVSSLRHHIIYPAGKGSSSIVRCFLEEMERP